MKKLNKISELARILMAIDSLEKRCFKRKEKKSALKYQIDLTDPVNFDKWKERMKYAKQQLVYIELYYNDF